MTNKFGVIGYSSYNIGDDIQSVAAKRFLPRVDSHIQRERVGSFESKEKTKLIMNAWWMWEPDNFPPSESIEPLLISMYFRKEIRPKLLEPKVKKYLIDHGPVGCRDTDTANYLESQGIPAYFSGCLTLTLKKYSNVKKEKFILAVDLPKEGIEYLKENSEYPVYDISRMLSPYFKSEARIEISELILYLYQSAHCVVSPCLHVVLPCLAMETPVLRVNIGDTTGAGTTISGDATGRYSGMEHLAHTTSLDSLIAGECDYNFIQPKKNPDDYIKIREELISKVKLFTGFDSGDTNNKFEFPLIDVFQQLKEDKAMKENALYYAGIKTLAKVLFRRIFLRKNRFDINI